MIRIICSNCGEIIEIDRLNNKVVCPNCGRIIKRGNNVRYANIINAVKVIE